MYIVCKIATYEEEYGNALYLLASRPSIAVGLRSPSRSFVFFFNVCCSFDEEKNKLLGGVGGYQNVYAGPRGARMCAESRRTR